MTERFHSLLPLVYRLRDGERGEPLRALLAVLEAAFEEVRDDVETLYDAWFIETCPPELVPYIGELVKARLSPVSAAPRVSARAYTADALALRRRRGTAAALEQAARGATGWPCRVVEGHQVTAVTADIRVPTRERLGTADIRTAMTARLAGTALDEMGHLFDARAVERGTGAVTGMGRVGVHLYRLRRFELERAECRPATAPLGGYWICPFGADSVLLNAPRSETEVDHRAEEEDLPVQLHPVPLRLELESDTRPHWFGSDPCVRIFVQESGVFVEKDIQISTLVGTTWPAPTSGAAFDPVRGRITLPGNATSAKVLATTGYGAYADLGGGPYAREESVRAMLGGAPDWQAIVSPESTSGAIVYTSISSALTAWSEYAAAATGPVVGLILLQGSRFHSLAGAPAVSLPPGCRLVIAAGDWPAEEDGSFDEGSWSARGQCATLLGALAVTTTSSPDDANGESLCLSGLWIDGRITVAAGRLAKLHVADCTVMAVTTAASAAIHVAGSTSNGGNDELVVALERCFIGGISCYERVPALTMDSCIIGPANPRITDHSTECLSALGAHARIESTTILGAPRLRSVELSNCIVTGVLVVLNQQLGYLRYSYLQPDYLGPPRHKVEEGVDDRPVFSGGAFLRLVADGYRRDPLFGRLHGTTSAVVLEGADDGEEMGAYRRSGGRARERNLSLVLSQFVRLGARAGVFYES